jgi:hypothetical protein
MKGAKQFSMLIFGVMLASPFLLFAHEWTQTDWSGGDGYFQWQDPTGYYEGSGVSGWRVPENILLFAPDFGNFVSVGKMQHAFGVYALSSDDDHHFYAGTGHYEADSARLFISQDCGATWDTTAKIGGPPFIYEVRSVFMPNCNHLFIGTNPPVIFRTHPSGDSLWEQVFTINYTKGEYLSSFFEADLNLYASSVRSANNQALIYRSSNNGTTWSADGFDQPKLNGLTPAAIHVLEFTEDSILYAAAYYTNYGARIFRLLPSGYNWELCANLPDTTRKPFAFDAGKDTAGTLGALYVGVGGDSVNVFRSIDQGNSWLGFGLPDNAKLMNGIVVDEDGSIYAACQARRGLNEQVRVFRSLDMGATWDSSEALGSDSTNKPTSFHQTAKGFLLVGTETNAEIFKAAYVDSGYLVSSVFDVGTGNGSSEWEIVWWQVNLNGQQLGIKVRTDIDSLMTGAVPWHLCTSVTNGQDISSLPSVTDGHRYIQYRAEFETDSVDYSAVLSRITIKYEVDSTAPRIDTAFASDGDSVGPGIDDDDYVMILFNDSTNTPEILADEINSILALSNGHSWWDGNGFVFAEWLSAESLKIWWPGLVGSPTVAVGDTIYPDTSTIADRWGNASYVPARIAGSFGPPGVGEDAVTVASSDRILIFPSITRQHLTVGVNLNEDSDMSIVLFDISGRFVCTLLKERILKGRHDVDIAIENQPVGIYFLKAQINHRSYTEKIVIVK